jgi:hypothetical protein
MGILGLPQTKANCFAPKLGAFLGVSVERRQIAPLVFPRRTAPAARHQTPPTEHSMRKILAFTALFAQAPAPAADEDAAFAEGVSRFGYLSGMVLQCADEAAVATVNTQIKSVFDRLNALFGTDTGFDYASAFGAGASATLDRAKCAHYSADFQQKLSQ